MIPGVGVGGDVGPDACDGADASDAGSDGADHGTDGVGGGVGGGPADYYGAVDLRDSCQPIIVAQTTCLKK